MNKKVLILSLISVSSISLNIFQFKQLTTPKTVSPEISTPHTPLVESATDTSNKSPVILHTLNPIPLVEEANTFSPSSFSAYGPIATLNPYAINQALQPKSPLTHINLGPSDDFFTKVSIEGFVPTSSIAQSVDTIKESSSPSNTVLMYIAEPCDGLLFPDKPAEVSYRYQPGSLVQVLYTFEDWCYVENQFNWDASERPASWVKKEHLAFYEAFDSNIGLMVTLKEDAVWEDGTPVDSCIHFGIITAESEDFYELVYVGTGAGSIAKKYIEDFAREKNTY